MRLDRHTCAFTGAKCCPIFGDTMLIKAALVHPSSATILLHGLVPPWSGVCQVEPPEAFLSS